MAIALEVGNPDDLATAYVNLTHILGLGGRVDEIVVVVREGADVLTRMGLARQRVSFLKANLAEALGNAGRIAEAGRVIAEAVSQHPRGVMAVPVLWQAGRVAMTRGDLDEAWEWLEQARVIVEAENAPESYRRNLIETEAEVELWAGRPVAAYNLVVDGLDLVRGTDEAAYAGTLVALGLRALATEAEAHRDRESRKRLSGMRRPLDDARRVAGGQPAGGRRRARVGAGPRQPGWTSASDPAAWTGPATAWRALGRPFPQAYARWREAEARLDSGVDAVAIDALRDAHTAARGAGRRPARAGVRTARRLAPHRPRRRARRGRDRTRLDSYGLTPPRGRGARRRCRQGGPTRRSPTSCSSA